MTVLLVLAVAAITHSFLLVMAIKGYNTKQCTVLWPILAGIALLCWVSVVFSISGLFKRGQDKVKGDK